MWLRLWSLGKEEEGSTESMALELDPRVVRAERAAIFQVNNQPKQT